VTLFAQCLVDTFYPGVAEAVVTIFERLGTRVDCPPEQTCCGQPAFNTGYRRQATAAARHFIEVFEDAGDIVCPSGSCVHMVRHGYAELFADDPAWLARSQDIAARTFELSEYLVDVLGITDLGATCQATLTYHDSCHLLRGLGVSRQPRLLIGAVRGARFIEMEESSRCCGFGGTFAVHYPEISTAMTADKVDNIVASGAEAVVGCDMSCLMNIEGLVKRRGLNIRVIHIAQLLAARGREDIFHE
jgi:L-lactate dehydrogenase complex protein LldE